MMVMSKFSNSLRISGYDQSYRVSLLEGIFKLHAEQTEAVIDGKRKEFRNREEIVSQKANKLGKHTDTWFLRGKTQNTLKVQATPGSVLVNALQKSQKNPIGAEGGATKFVELGGNLVSHGLSNQVGFTGNKGCFYGQKCLVSKEQDCRKARAVYKIHCMNCQNLTDPKQSVYIGTTG